MPEDHNFCTGCGGKLEPGMQFCPKCGKVIEGTEAQAAQAKEYAAMEQMVKDSHRNFILFALAIYAIPAIIAGILAIIDAGGTASTIWNNGDFQNFYHEHGWTFSEHDLQNYITYIGIMVLGSGVCVLGSLICIYKRVQQKVAFVLCLIGALLCIWSIFGAFIGILMAWTIYSADELFENPPSA